MKNTQSLIVSSLKQETLNSVVISFEVPPNLKNQYTFKAGQYLTLSSNINGEKVKRSYSICSSPHGQNLQVGVKAIENGVFSNYVNDALREGDSIEVSIPSSLSQKNYFYFSSLEISSLIVWSLFSTWQCYWNKSIG